MVDTVQLKEEGRRLKFAVTEGNGVLTLKKNWRRIWTAPLFAFSFLLVYLSLNTFFDDVHVIETIGTIYFLYMLYASIAEAVNATTIKINPLKLSTRYGPLPLRRGVEADLAGIKQLFLKDSHFSGWLAGRGANRNCWEIIGHDEYHSEKKLFSSVPYGQSSGLSKDQVLFILKAISTKANIPVVEK